MRYTTILTAETLHQNLANPDWVIMDCRFSLSNPQSGELAYRQGHLPQARYAHLNNELSSMLGSLTGRHPLPNFKVLSEKLGAWGIHSRSQVVVYDDVNGAFAGRLWWLLRCLGHDHVAVLDGGVTHWRHLGLPMTTRLPRIKAADFRPYLNQAQWLTATDVQTGLSRKTICLLDARTPERYQGIQEPIDPVAGHIPSALNRPIQNNLAPNGLFLSAAQLKQQFKQLIGNHSAEQVVHYCGSGVTACHNVLAMEYAGLSGSKLYAGSWSDWISNKNRPITALGTIING